MRCAITVWVFGVHLVWLLRTEAPGGAWSCGAHRELHTAHTHEAQLWPLGPGTGPVSVLLCYRLALLYMKRNGVKSMLKEAARRSACVCVCRSVGRALPFLHDQTPNLCTVGGTLVARYAGGRLLPK